MYLYVSIYELMHYYIVKRIHSMTQIILPIRPQQLHPRTPQDSHAPSTQQTFDLLNSTLPPYPSFSRYKYPSDLHNLQLDHFCINSS